ARPGLQSENVIHTRQRPWRAEISQRSGAIGPEVCPCVGAALIHGCGRLPHSHPSTNGCSAGRGATGSRNGSYSSAQFGRSRPCQRLLPLLLSKGLRRRGAYFEQARPLLPNSSRIPESLAYV